LPDDLITVTAGFADHFSSSAADYAAHRPTYPAALFDWLAGLCPGHDLAWDCGTGSGQAAEGLAGRFARVIATDASAKQLAHARPVPNVEYRIATAEQSGLGAATVDLVTAAAAAHWFDLPRFYGEVRRVTKLGGILALWMYHLIEIEPAIDNAIVEFYRGPVGPYWPGERALVDGRYQTIDFPFEEITPPVFAMAADWTLRQVLGYLRTWSAVGRYVRAVGTDPVEAFAPTLGSLWGDPDETRRVRWPLHARVGRVEPA
jgi:ubiquinone/menaquinone biosynthesis C-methylase UbiE